MQGSERIIGIGLIALGLLTLGLFYAWGRRGSPFAPAGWGWRMLPLGLSFLVLSVGYGVLLYPYLITPTPASAPPAAPSHPTPVSFPSPSPSPTGIPSAPLTPTSPRASPSPVPSPSPSPTSSPFACDPGVMETIEQANHAQEDYLLGRGTLEQLNAAWGDAAPEARRQADRLRQAAQASGATLTDVRWEIGACTVSARPGPDLLEVRTEETWTYVATLNCPPGRTARAERIVTYPGEIYRLAAREGGWRILRWTPGEGSLRQDWRCP
ncbi:MAG: hypothetical protein KNN16_03065 [Thermoflexus hugenholtzii]|uniref:hypothetical protein n=1 Tax=Thermoflexus TaxID=1495649 RepID=UPI001C764A56|nr:MULTISPECIES: hypothetical protein [Thermoflexus]QWK11267.1 MAG: hypothetical protein KNN16_03065 [Thermoflexus hugenholtzii]